MKLLLLTLVITFKLSAAVWSTDKVWNEENELAYSKWVETSWTNDVFTNARSPLYGLKTDCADASYAMRAYYAFLNGLPVYFHRYDPSGPTAPWC